MRGLTGAVLLDALFLSLGTTVRGAEKAGPSVVFVCEHGTVKSVIAMLWFNRLATERGLEIRAISRGMDPDSAVPQDIVDRLGKEGLKLGTFAPKAFVKDDLAQAVRVVAIGVDTTEIMRDARVPAEAWNDIPPATQDYGAARDAMRIRIERLLTTLVRPEHPK